MSLNVARRIATAIITPLACYVIACGQQTPTSPSLVGPRADIGPIVGESFVTLADETPAPDPGPTPDPSPAPEPTPAPKPPPTSPDWRPDPPPKPAPGAPAPTPPSTHIRLLIKIDPEPVPHSGKRITDVAACTGEQMKYTWFYDQILHADTGVAVVLSERENFFDGVFTGNSSGGLSIPANGTIVVHSRWCSGNAEFHYAQTRYKGRDDYGQPIEISGPWVRLMPP
jgi:hypothetical protein